MAACVQLAHWASRSGVVLRMRGTGFTRRGLRNRLPGQISRRHLSVCQHFDLKRFIQTHTARAAQPMVDFPRAERRIEQLPEGSHRDAVLLKVVSELH